MIHQLFHSFDIQLFAGSKVDEKGITGVKKALDAGEQTAGVIAPDAGEDSMAQRAERFEALIRGEYKDLYDAHVQHIVTKRLKGSEETVKKYKALAPALQLLEKKYGVAPGDAQALSDALCREDSERIHKSEALARRQYARWLHEAGRVKESYPDFDISRELGDERFCQLLRSGVPVGDAYELVHHKELMEKAAEEMEEGIRRRILSGSQRPREGGISAQSGATMKNDVSQMSKKTRQDIIRRVQRGEKISF